MDEPIAGVEKDSDDPYTFSLAISPLLAYEVTLPYFTIQIYKIKLLKAAWHAYDDAGK